MTRSKFITTLFSLVVAMPVVRLSADQTIVVNADRDNVIYQDNTSNSNGAGDYIFAGRNGGGSARRSLLRFDLSAIPENAVIEQASISLFLSQTSSPDFDVSLHRLLSDWGESTSDGVGGEGGGAPAEPGDATWDQNFFPDSNWMTAGGDFLAMASASETVGGIGSYSWTSSLLADDIQGWLDGDFDNFGWALIGDESTFPTTKRFNSRTNSTGNPSLTIQFSVIPEPSILAIGSILSGLLFTVRRRS